MKNYSAPKLLRMMLAGEHMSYCPHKGTKLSDCKCWVHEVKKWEERIKQASTNRVRKGKPGKVHYDGVKCSVRVRQHQTQLYGEVTCAQCFRFMNKPPKKKGVVKAGHLSLVTAIP